MHNFYSKNHKKPLSSLKLVFVAMLSFFTLVVLSSVYALPTSQDAVSSNTDFRLGSNLDLTSVSGQPSNTNSPLGTGLSEIADWNTEFVFVDAFKASRDWVSKDAASYNQDNRSIDTDESGWVRSLSPNQVVETYLFSGMSGIYTSGKYIVLYDGEGEISYGGSAIKDDAASTPGRDVVSVDASNNDGVILDIVSTNPNNYLRNIRFIMPGGICNNDMFHYAASATDCADGTYTSFEQNYQTQVFHPLFLNSIKNYRAIRFMNWMFICWEKPTNRNPIEWKQRPKLTDARWATTPVRGVPVEIIVDLCNRLHADGWFNLHYLASDDYITQFATYVRDHLDPSLKSYVEYSNEVWNNVYPEEQYAEDKGMELHLSETNDPFEAGLRYYSQRAVEMFNIWMDVFKQEAPKRVVRVLASHSMSPWMGVIVMDWKQAYKQADAFAVAPYMSILDTTVSFASVDDVFNNLNQQLDTDLTDMGMKENIANAKQRGLIPVAYEAGIELRSYDGSTGQDNPKLTDLYITTNRDSRMKDLYTRFLQSWKASGGQLMMHLMNTEGYSRNGEFSLQEYYNQPLDKAPKKAAVLDYIAQNPCWWEGCGPSGGSPQPSNPPLPNTINSFLPKTINPSLQTTTDVTLPSNPPVPITGDVAVSPNPAPSTTDVDVSSNPPVQKPTDVNPFANFFRRILRMFHLWTNA